MAIAVHNITGDSWTPITAAGLSGTCWLQEIPGKGQVVINHSDTLTEFEIDESYFLLNAKRRLLLIKGFESNNLSRNLGSLNNPNSTVIKFKYVGS